MADYNDEAPVLEISGLRLSYYTRAGEVPRSWTSTSPSERVSR